MKILFASNSFKLDDLHKDQLKNFEVDYFEGKEKIDKLIDYDRNVGEDFVLISKPAGFEGEWNSLPANKLAKLKNLKGIILGTTSFSWVDYVMLREAGIDVMNTPRKSTNAVAEYNFFCMHALYRKYPLILKGMEAGLLEEIKGKTAGIVGLGEIGTRTGELCDAHGMNVIFYNRSKKNVKWDQLELDQVISRSDVIFVTIAANSELHGFITKKHLQNLKKDALFISITHHEVYDIEYLLELAGDFKIGGLAYEDDESNIKDFKGNIFITPEFAYYTRQTLKNESDIAINTAIEYVSGNKINLIN